MEWTQLNDISPLVREVKITKSDSLTGEWTDFDHVFTFIEQGEADFILNGIKYRVKEGDVILVPPLVPHIIRSTSKEALIQYIFHFDLFYSEKRSQWKVTGVLNDRQREVPVEETLLFSILPISNISINLRIKVRQIFIEMYQEYRAKQELSILKLKSSTIDLLIIFLRNQMNYYSPNGKLTKGWNIIEKTINIIQEHYSDPDLSNASLSDYVGFSPSYIAALFKDQLGVTVYNYITHVRIEHAKKRMIDGIETLTIISEKVGYGSIYSFSRSFKQNVGMTPSEFIELHSKKTENHRNPLT